MTELQKVCATIFILSFALYYGARHFWDGYDDPSPAMILGLALSVFSAVIGGVALIWRY